MLTSRGFSNFPAERSAAYRNRQFGVELSAVLATQVIILLETEKAGGMKHPILISVHYSGSVLPELYKPTQARSEESDSSVNWVPF